MKGFSNLVFDRQSTEIPIAMATQHPDNASAPYWKDSPFISTSDEEKDCFLSYSELDCDEYMWDWEGKFVDEAVVDRLFNKHHDYFKKNQLGKNKFLTFRIPNVWHEKGYRLARAYMGMLTANESAEDLGMHSPPIFEVILPMTDSAKKLIEIQTQYTKIARMKCSVFGSDFCRDDIVSMIPLIEGGDALLKSYKILADYSKMFRKKF